MLRSRFMKWFAGAEMPEHHQALMHLKRIIDLIEYQDPKYLDNYNISQDGQLISFTTRTTKQAKHVRLKSLNLHHYSNFDKNPLYEWQASCKEYKDVYNTGKRDMNFVRQEVRPIYDLLVNTTNNRFIIVLMDFNLTLQRLAGRLQEIVLQDNLDARILMEEKAIEILKSFVNAVKDEVYRISDEQQFFKENMSKHLLADVDDELKYVQHYLTKKEIAEKAESV